MTVSPLIAAQESTFADALAAGNETWLLPAGTKPVPRFLMRKPDLESVARSALGAVVLTRSHPDARSFSDASYSSLSPRINFGLHKNNRPGRKRRPGWAWIQPAGGGAGWTSR